MSSQSFSARSGRDRHSCIRGVLSACAALLLFTACKTPPPPAEAPEIVSFAASKAELDSGDPVTLTWQVKHATTVELFDESGAAVETQGDSATFTPERTHFYVLRAKGAGGQRSAFVQVAVGEPLKSVALVAVPSTINSGDTAQLLWSAPRNRSAKLVSSEGEVTGLIGDSGSVDVRPSHSATFTLSADPGNGAALLTTSVDVHVRPVISSFASAPIAAHAGEALTLSWKTAGAAQLSIVEQTFGAVTVDASQLDEGSAIFTIPAALPNGSPVEDGMTLQFTLTAKAATSDDTATARLEAFVGTAPEITSFAAPLYCSASQSCRLQWSTVGASRITVLADGLQIFETLPGEEQRAKEGELLVPAPAVSATYELIAVNDQGIPATATATTTAVLAPTIDSYTLTSSVTAPGGAATAQWKTSNASRVILRTDSGAAIFHSSDPSTVAAHSVDLGIGQSMAVTLEAWNLAGEHAELTLSTLTTGGLATTDAGTSLPTIPVTVSYDGANAQASELAGVPSASPTRDDASTAFVDLAQEPLAHALSFGASGLAELSPGDGFRFPFFGKTYGVFQVALNGVVGLSPQRPLTSDNQNLVDAELGQALAPFWDTLQLGQSGKVLWHLEDGEFPRRLIIEWSSVNREGDPSSSLSFELQLYESGEFHFVYGNLTGVNSHGESATIGVLSEENGFVAQAPSNAGAPVVSKDAELTWFKATGPGSFTAVFPDSVKLPLLGKNSSGRWVAIEAPVRVFAPGSIAITEAMPVPNASVSATGQWVELQNLGEDAVDLEGLVLRSQSSTSGYTFPQLIVPPLGVVVIGQSKLDAENDEAHVQYTYSDVPLAAVDDLRLNAGNGTISRLLWTAAPQAGHSIEAPQPFAWRREPGTTPWNATAVPLSCPSTTAFNGAMTAYGSPGKASRCMSYVVQKIPGAFRDISRTGLPLFSSTAVNEVTSVLSLGATGFPYFGVSQHTVSLASTGYLQFSNATVAYNNPTVPSDTRIPQGAVAPFWAPLQFRMDLPSNAYAQHFADGEDSQSPAAHWVFQWSHFQENQSGDDLNFEAKLFDSGLIEFHYATLLSGSGASHYGDGNAATVWIEQPGVARALALGREEAVLRPFSGVRFIPLP